MTTLNVNLPDELAAKLRARAAASGNVSMDAYVSELIRDQMELMDLGRPPKVLDVDDEKLEDDLVRRIGDSRPDVEATPEFWAGLKRGVREHGGDAKRS